MEFRGRRTIVAALMIGAALAAVAPPSRAAEPNPNASPAPAGGPPETVAIVLVRPDSVRFDGFLLVKDVTGASTVIRHAVRLHVDSVVDIDSASVIGLRWYSQRPSIDAEHSAVNVPANVPAPIATPLRASSLSAGLQARYRTVLPVAFANRHVSTYRAGRVIGLNAFPLYL
jgi:hypothetical protein